MGRRLGQVAGLLAAALVVARLDLLLMSGPELVEWPPILVAAFILGLLVRWLVGQTSLSPWPAGMITALGAILVLQWVTAPETVLYGVVPTSETLPVLLEQLQIAGRVFRSGVPPVVPTIGLVGVLAALMWFLGSTFAIGSLTGSLALMVIPSGFFYLQLALLDRVPASRGWHLATATAVALACGSLAMERRRQSGRARAADGTPKPQRALAPTAAALAVVMLLSVLATARAAPLVSEYGNLPWRNPSTAGGVGFDLPGPIVFDRFIDLRQRLLSRQNAVLFRATFAGTPPPAMYWRMETLDSFDGAGWGRSPGQIRAYQPGVPVGDPQHGYFGSGDIVVQRVFVDRLGGQLLPSAGYPLALVDTGSSGIPPALVSHARDAALILSLGLDSGFEYQLTSFYPNLQADLGALATGPDGDLTPLFAAAAAVGDFTALPRPGPDSVQRPTDLPNFLRVPNDLPDDLTRLARERTAGATTAFERAWMLQHWFRDSGDFRYSINVTTGNRALNLLDWMTDPESLNYRTGYCEQFAAALALLARLVGIPSRVVWGFAPGERTFVDGLEVLEVRDTNAHAWVELWIDGFGWVLFDPTPRGDLLPPSPTSTFDPGAIVVQPPTGEVPEPVDPGAPGLFDLPPVELGGRVESGTTPWARLLVGLTLFVALLLNLAKRARRERRIRRLDEGDVTAAWEEIVDHLTDMGIGIDSSLTPIEMAQATVPELGRLATEYSAAVYGGVGGRGRPEMLTDAEDWIGLSYDRRTRIRGALNPRSLFVRRR